MRYNVTLMSDKKQLKSDLSDEVTRRKLAETELGQVQEIFRLLVDAVTDYAIFALDKEGRILTWNPGAQRLKGYTANEIIGKHFSTFYTKPDIERKHPQWELETAIENGKYEEEGWRVRKDGTQFWANVVINKLLDQNGRFIGFSKITRDLTDRMRAQQKLQESEERSRLMIQGVRDYAIFMLDPQGMVATWNEGAERIKQYSSEEIIGKSMKTFYSEEDLKAKKPEMELEVATAVGRFEDEGWRVRKDGTRFWANVIITAVRNSSGKLMGFSKITRDLTERKNAEEKLKELNDGLEKKVQDRTQELETAVKSRDEFLSLASHELKTPLTTLKLQNQLRRKTLEKQGIAPFTQEKLNKIIVDDERQVDRLTRLVDDMLDITRLNVGKLSLRKEACNLTDLTKDVIDRFMSQFEATKTEVTFEADDAIGNWDPHRIDQVVTNLITNALKYGPGKPLQIRIRNHSNKTLLEVQDHGKGIDPKDHDRIFQQFERAIHANEVSGLGLGLFIVKQIILAHGGKIWVESSLGEGSNFKVELPL